MSYSAVFKAKMVQKMASPHGPTAAALAQEIGVHKTTLSRWLRDAGTVSVVSIHDPADNRKGSRRLMTPKRPQDWTAEAKLEVVLEAANLPEEELGAFLRRKGLHEAHLQQWRERMLSGLKEPVVRKSTKKSPETKKVRDLEKELARKEKALAEAAALLILKKKVQAIWGDEDDDTAKKSGK